MQSLGGLSGGTPRCHKWAYPSSEVGHRHQTVLVPVEPIEKKMKFFVHGVNITTASLLQEVSQIVQGETCKTARGRQLFL